LSAIVSQFTNPARAQKVAAIGQDSSKPFAPKPPLTMKTLRMLALIRVVDKLLAAANRKRALLPSARIWRAAIPAMLLGIALVALRWSYRALCHFAKS
jgi:hypothetical protein